VFSLKRSALAAGFAGLLVVAILPASAAADESDEQKVDPEIRAEVAAKGSTHFYLMFKEQADVQAAASGHKGKDRVAAVVAALQKTSAGTQSHALAKLREEQAAGHVKGFTAFWAVDAIEVEGDSKAITDLAALPEAGTLLRSSQVSLDSATSQQATAPGRSIVPAAPAGNARGGNKGARGAASPSSDPDCAGLSDDVQWNIKAVRADQVWNDFTGYGVVVGLIDTGADYRHPVIASGYAQDGETHVYSWLDTINHRDVPYDDNGHGTHTTGTVSGKCGIGVAPDAEWIMAKVFRASGPSMDFEILPAMQWMLAPGGDPGHAPEIVSNSWGGGPPINQVFRPVVQDWVAAGILPVFSNGNGGPGPATTGHPAGYPESFAVGNLDYGVYGGIKLGTSPDGPGPLIAVTGSGPPPSALTAPFHFVGEACSPVGDDLTGKIGLVARGSCPFATKHDNVKAAGAVAMIVHNNAAGAPVSMGGIPPDGIQSLAITLSDGLALRTFEGTPGATISIDPLTLLRTEPNLDPPVVATSSSRGPGLDGIVKPNVSAPGTFVLSAAPRDMFAVGFRFLSGTSMAAPHVAGTAALMLDANDNLDVADLERIIQSTCHPLGAPIPNNNTGYGTIDAFAAVQAAKGA
jgi:subtilisin family serine protease